MMRLTRLDQWKKAFVVITLLTITITVFNKYGTQYLLRQNVEGDGTSDLVTGQAYTGTSSGASRTEVTRGLVHLNVSYGKCSPMPGHNAGLRVCKTENNNAKVEYTFLPGLVAPQQPIKYSSYKEALEGVAINKTVVLTMTDQAFIEMAINLYESSFAKLGITNYLFICIDKNSFNILQDLGIASYLYADIKSGSQASNYATKSFADKVRRKMGIVKEALTLGYKALLLDVDIVMYKNPFPYFNCSDCDVQFQHEDTLKNNRILYNTGFYFIRPTPKSIKMLSEGMRLAKGGIGFDDTQGEQPILNKVIIGSKMKIKHLDIQLFATGRVFYHRDRKKGSQRKSTADVVMVHNNWIIGRDKKIERFRINNQWFVDRNFYYSNPKNRYLMFSVDGNLSSSKKFLLTAFTIAYLLQRIVILPANFCSHELCPVDTTSLQKAFPDKLRAFNFLTHPKVPYNSSDVTTVYIGSSSGTTANKASLVFLPANQNEGVTPEEIVEWFAPLQCVPVLDFENIGGQLLQVESSGISNDLRTFLTELKKAVAKVNIS